jgi:hypothetical protein
VPMAHDLQDLQLIALIDRVADAYHYICHFG